MKIILYSTGCPKCKILSEKLTQKNIGFEVINDVAKMTELGISQVPVLSVDGCLLSFQKAVSWVNDMGVIE